MKNYAYVLRIAVRHFCFFIQYLVIEPGEWDYFLYYLFVALCAGLLGRIKIQAYLKKTGKQATVVLLLAWIITASFVLMCYVSIERIVDNVRNDVPFEMQEPHKCHVHK